MSIEALIQALLANTEAVKLLTLSLAGRTPAKSEDKAAKTEKPSAKVEEKKAEPVGDGVTDDTAALQAIVGEEPKADEPVPYETVRALVLKLAPMVIENADGSKTVMRDAIKALNAKHGIANLKVLLDKEDDFSTVNDQVKLEAVYADLQALEG